VGEWVVGSRPINFSYLCAARGRGRDLLTVDQVRGPNGRQGEARPLDMRRFLFSAAWLGLLSALLGACLRRDGSVWHVCGPLVRLAGTPRDADHAMMGLKGWLGVGNVS
jgi:hypothetical protein